MPGFDTKLFGNAILALGVFGCITACLGIAAAKKKNAFFTLPFMIISGLVGLALLAFAAVILGLDKGFVEKFTKGSCEKISNGNDRNMPDDYDYLVSRTMCSNACPCDEQYKSIWMDPNIPESRFKDATDIKRSNFVWASAANGGVTQFLQCYNKNVKLSTETKWTDLRNFFEGEAFKFLEATEEKLGCSSICRPGLFYIS